jgi:hypothetical protein
MFIPARRGLSIKAFGAPIGSLPSAQADYSRYSMDLTFTTLAPGGFGDLTMKILTTSDGRFSSRLPRPELMPFSRVVVSAGRQVVFLGEIQDSTSEMSGGQESITVRALGYGSALRDDPLTIAYNAQTGLQIVTDQFSQRATYNLPISSDTVKVFPDAPATTLSVAYTLRTMEEVIQDVATLLGAYIWFVWDHAWAKDALGFPLGQLSVMLRDTTTTHYQASLLERDITAYTITPSTDRAYGVVSIGYNDPNATGPAVVTVTDSRLAGDGSIGTAPFRRRKYTRDFSGLQTMTSTQATAFANTLLGLYKNVGNKISITVKSIHDAAGKPVPLHLVRAGNNILLRDVFPRGQQLPLSAAASVNQFFILKTTYREASDGPELDLECDNYYDESGTMLARLQLVADRTARTALTTTGTPQATGAQYKGWAYASAVATAGGQTFTLAGTTFPDVLKKVPTTVTFQTPAFSVNNTGAGANTLGIYGFNAWVTSTAAGAVNYGGTWISVGNCLYDVDVARGTFTHHCGGYVPAYPGAQFGSPCNLLRKGLRFDRDVQVTTGSERHHHSLSVTCPVCGAVECANLDLGLEDETDEHAHHAEQSRMVRALMRQTGLHHLVRDCDCAACLPQDEHDAGQGQQHATPREERAQAPAKARKPRARRKAIQQQGDPNDPQRAGDLQGDEAGSAAMGDEQARQSVLLVGGADGGEQVEGEHQVEPLTGQDEGDSESFHASSIARRRDDHHRE